MPINQYGQNVDDQQNLLGPSSVQSTPGVGSNPQAQQANTNPFGSVASNQVNALGAAPVAPPVVNFAFSDKYAAQNQGLEQLLADKTMERQNQLFSAQQSYDRNVGDAGRTRDKALESLINKYASSGMIGSGIDARSRGDLENDYQRYLGDLSLALGNTRQGIEGNWASTIRNVNDQRTQMWGNQRADEQAARDAAEQRRLAAEQQQREAENARYIAEQSRLAAEANARNQPVINMPGVTTPGIGGGGAGYGGGGGGGGLGITGMEAAGIDPTATMQDLQGQINLLFNTGGTHQLALMYSHPYFQTPNMQPMKDAIRSMISQMSTPGNPYYSPARPGDSNPGGFY